MSETFKKKKSVILPNFSFSKSGSGWEHWLTDDNIVTFLFTYRQIPSNSTLIWEVKCIPKRPGLRKLIASLNCDALRHVYGELSIQIQKPWPKVLSSSLHLALIIFQHKRSKIETEVEICFFFFFLVIICVAQNLIWKSNQQHWEERMKNDLNGEWFKIRYT